MIRNKQKIKVVKRMRRKARVRAKIFGVKEKPRLSVYRSLKHIYAQLINDDEGKTLVATSDMSLKHPSTTLGAGKNTLRLRSGQVKTLKQEGKETKGKEENVVVKMSTKCREAFEVGKLLAQKALEKKIKKCVFDKSAYKYHGRVKSLAEGAREGGLQF